MISLKDAVCDKEEEDHEKGLEEDTKLKSEGNIQIFPSGQSLMD